LALRDPFCAAAAFRNPRLLPVSALLSGDEAVEHLLQAVDLTLVEVAAGLDPVAENCRPQA
jgi:hypothetical protein